MIPKLPSGCVVDLRKPVPTFFFRHGLRGFHVRHWRFRRYGGVTERVRCTGRWLVRHDIFDGYKRSLATCAGRMLGVIEIWRWVEHPVELK